MAKVSGGKAPQVKVKAQAKPVGFSWKTNWMVLVIVGLCFLLYINTCWNKYAMDDELATSTFDTENEHVSKGIGGIPAIFSSFYSEGKLKYEYRPIVKATFAIEHQFFGVNPGISHFINLLLYIFTCLLLFKLLQKLMQEYSKLFIFFIVVIFMAHPVHTEVVASLKNRDEILSFMFSMITLNYLLSFARKGKWVSLAFAFFFYIVAYLSKSSALVFLAVFPVILYFFSDISWKKLLLIFAVILVAVIISRYGPKTFLPKPEREVFFFENPLKSMGMFARIPTGMRGLLFYLQILIIPHPLLFYYGYNMIPVSKYSDPWVIISLLIHLALFIYAVLKIKQKHILSFAILYYLVSISMFANIVKPAMGIVAERFVYASSLAFCIALAYFIFKFMKVDLLQKNVPGSVVKKLFVPLVILMIPYSFKTIARNTTWYDKMTLYSNDIEYLENSAKANALIAGQMNAEATNELSEMLSEKSSSPQFAKNLDRMEEKFDSVIFYYQSCIDIYPDYFSSYNNIGQVYFTKANLKNFRRDSATAKVYFETAVSDFQKALAIRPEYPEAMYNLAYSYEMLADYDSAIVFYRKNLLQKGYNVKSFDNMADIYYSDLNLKDSAIAINKRWAAADTSSDKPFLNLGTYAYKDGDTLTAISYYETAMDKSKTNIKLANFLSEYFRKHNDQVKYKKYSQIARDEQKKKSKSN